MKKPKGEYAIQTVINAMRLLEAFRDEEAAPLLCAGIIGYRSLRQSGIRPGQRLGLYGFGASAHLTLQRKVTSYTSSYSAHIDALFS